MFMPFCNCHTTYVILKIIPGVFTVILTLAVKVNYYDLGLRCIQSFIQICYIRLVLYCSKDLLPQKRARSTSGIRSAVGLLILLLFLEQLPYNQCNYSGSVLELQEYIHKQVATYYKPVASAFSFNT